jgi:hypothetical protein
MPLLAEQVFITDGFPEHTYIPFQAGKKEEELQEGFEQKNKIISISGPSKSGKTTLCDQVFGTQRGVSRLYVTGDAIQRAEDLWFEAYRQLQLGPERNFNDDSYSERIDTLVSSDLPLVIDDFHYIQRELQPVISRQLKNAASQGLRIVCLSVPHRGDDPVRSNPDLSGRFFSVNFEFWTPQELMQIASVGFPQVGFQSNDSFNEILASEALRSPQIMQTLCLETCRAANQDIPFESTTLDEAILPDVKKRTLRSYNQATALDFLRNGPPTRGSERLNYKLKDGRESDVYECLIAALRLDPPFQHLDLDEIRERVRSILNDTREPNIRSALQQYTDLFKEQTCPFDWDDEKRRLTIVDPHFYFYLRNVE